MKSLFLTTLIILLTSVAWGHEPNNLKTLEDEKGFELELILSTIETIAHRSMVAEDIINQIILEGESLDDPRLLVSLESVENLTKMVLKMIHQYDLPS